MVMRINGLGHGPLADRRLLGERQRRDDSQQDGAPRNEEDQVLRRAGPSEQLRAEFAAINHAIQQTEDALAMATRADEGLAQVQAHLETLQRALKGPTRDGEPSPPERLAETLAAIARVAEETRFGALRLLDGSLGCTGVAVGDGLEFIGAGRETRSSPPQGYEVLLAREPMRATVLGERALTPPRIAQGVQLVLREGGHTARLTTRTGQSAAQVAATLHAEAKRAGLALTVEATGDGRLLVQHRCFGSAYRFAVASSLPGVLSTAEGGVRLVANGCDIAGTMHGEPAHGEGRTLTGCTGNLATAGLVVRYTGLPFTGATQRLPRKPASVLEPKVFAGRVVVAQQALAFRLGGDPGETLSLQLGSVHPEHLGRGVTTDGGAASLAEARAGTPAEVRDARTLAAHALGEVQRQRESLREVIEERLTGTLARLRVQAQNLAAASQDLLAPGAALQAVQALSQHILREARTALSAQAHPPQSALLGLLGEQSPGRGQRWN